MNYIQTPDELLKRLSIQSGGSIVCSGSCNELEIAHAQACGRIYVDDFGIGYVLRPETEKTAKQIRTEACADERRRVLEEAASIAEEGQFQIGCTAIEAEGVVRRTRDAIAAHLRQLAGQPEEMNR